MIGQVMAYLFEFWKVVPDAKEAKEIVDGWMVYNLV
jgi:hypothetical protein